MLLESVRRDIAAYVPADPREQGFRDRMLTLLEQPAPCSRQSFTPGHLTASAFVLSPAADALLLIFHKKLEIWVQPGGHLEPDDVDLQSAARRELLEEVGLALPANTAGAIFDLDIHAIPARKTEPAHEHFDVRYCFRAPSLELTVSEEVAAAKWAPLERIEQLTSDESVQRAVRKLRNGARV